MFRSYLRYFIPAGLAIALLVVLHAQNTQPGTVEKPAATGATQAPPRPTIPRPKAVVLPPTAAPGGTVAPPPATGSPAPAPVPTTVSPEAAAPTPPAANPAAPATPATPATPSPGAGPAVNPAASAAEAVAPKSPNSLANPGTPVTPSAPTATVGRTPAPAVPPTVAPSANGVPTATAPSAASAQVRPALPITNIGKINSGGASQGGNPAPGNPPPPPAPGASGTAPANAPLEAGATDAAMEFNEATTDVGVILDKYEILTGRHTIRAAEVAGTIPIHTSASTKAQKLNRQQATEFIKAYLLLNGIAIVPSDIDGVDKVLPAVKFPTLEQGKEAPPVYTEAEPLPENEQIINFVMYMKNISADEAVRALQNAAQGRQSGKIVAVPNAGAVIITDNIPAIRLLRALKEKIDVPPATVVKKFFQLQRADAEDVAAVINDLLAAQAKLRNQQSGSGGRSVSPGAAAQSIQPNIPGLPPGVVNNAAANQAGQGGGAQPPDESSVIVKGIPRTNEVLVSGRPGDIKYIEDFIKELDKEAQVKNLQRFQLRYIRVEEFLDIANDAIGRGQEVIQGGGSTGGAATAGSRTSTSSRTPGGQGSSNGFTGGSQFNGGQTLFSGNSSASSRSSRTSSSGSGGGIGGGGGGVSRGRSSSSGGNTMELVPTSTVVGKTLLIAEPRSNTLLVAGPPEHIVRIREVLREIDQRPLQVSISAVIAEVTLSDDLQHGFDLLRRAERAVVGGQNLNFAGAFQPSTGGTGLIDVNRLVGGTNGDLLSGFTDAGVIGTGSGLDLYAQVGELFNVYIRALENTGKVKVLSRPFVFTANNKPASISIGERVPVPASSQSSVVTGNTTTFNTNIEYEDVNLLLEVTPLINSRDEVTLQVAQTNDDILEFVTVGNQEAPRISQQDLDTEVAIPNGCIAVIGGLIRDKANENNAGLPIISRIPVLKSIFGSRGVTKSRRELLIFIQPRIVDTSDDLTAMHTDHLRRTVIGKEAEAFAQPAYDTSDVKAPTADGGEEPLEHSEGLLPPAEGVNAVGPAPDPDHDKRPVNEKVVPSVNPSTGAYTMPLTSRTQPLIWPPQQAQRRPDVTLDPKNAEKSDADKPRRAYWENDNGSVKSGASPESESKSSGKVTGLKKILPWNWGK